MFDDHNGLRITEVNITLASDARNDALKAYAKVVFNDAFMVRNIRIVKPPSGRPVVAMPGRLLANGVNVDLAHPLTPGSRAWLGSAVLRAYEAELRRVAELRSAAEVDGLRAAG